MNKDGSNNVEIKIKFNPMLLLILLLLVIIVLLLIFFVLPQFTHEKMICESDDGNITVMYEDVDFEDFAGEFDEWFSDETDGRCRIDGKRVSDYDDDDDEEQISNYEKELRKAAKKVDDDGNYNYELFEKRAEELFEKYGEANTDSEVISRINEMADIVFCTDYECIIIEPRKNDFIIHLYFVNDDEYKTLNYVDMSAELALSTACSSVDNNGNLDMGDYYNGSFTSLNCNNYVCSVNYKEKLYTKDCRK